MYVNNYTMYGEVFEFIFAQILFKKYISKYVVFNNIINNEKILELNIYYLSFYKEYKIFNNISEYLKEYYINNPIFNTSIKYNNKYFDKKIYDNKNDTQNVIIDIDI